MCFTQVCSFIFIRYEFLTYESSLSPETPFWSHFGSGFKVSTADTWCPTDMTGPWAECGILLGDCVKYIIFQHSGDTLILSDMHSLHRHTQSMCIAGSIPEAIRVKYLVWGYNSSTQLGTKPHSLNHQAALLPQINSCNESLHTLSSSHASDVIHWPKELCNSAVHVTARPSLHNLIGYARLFNSFLWERLLSGCHGLQAQDILWKRIRYVCVRACTRVCVYQQTWTPLYNSKWNTHWWNTFLFILYFYLFGMGRLDQFFQWCLRGCSRGVIDGPVLGDSMPSGGHNEVRGGGGTCRPPAKIHPCTKGIREPHLPVMSAQIRPMASSCAPVLQGYMLSPAITVHFRSANRNPAHVHDRMASGRSHRRSRRGDGGEWCHRLNWSIEEGGRRLRVSVSDACLTKQRGGRIGGGTTGRGCLSEAASASCSAPHGASMVTSAVGLPPFFPLS